MLKKLHLSSFTIRELHYHRPFKIDIKVCSEIPSSNHPPHTHTTECKSVDQFL